MRILYGVQTTGRGHLVRSRAMIAGLKARGHEVETLLSGPTVEPQWLDTVFEPWSHRRGLTHVSRNGKISYLATARQLRLLEFVADVRGFDADGFDLVVSDYEPITARVAARAGLPSVGVGHLFAFDYSVPVAGRNLFNQAIMRRFAPVRVPLGLHWHHFGEPILPPTIPADVPSPEEATHEGPVVVYLSFESLDEVVELLRGIGHIPFKVYARVESPERRGNVEILPTHRDRFLAHLVRARGVICNAGFSLISEALHLGKRVLAKPVVHQTEQESNAKALAELGFGTVCRRLSREVVVEWLESPIPRPMRYPDVMSSVLDWIDGARWDDVGPLARGLWSRVAGATSHAARTGNEAAIDAPLSNS